MVNEPRSRSKVRKTMVATPWGDSKKLQKRKLPAGRATPPDEVAQNQRARIFGAVVASVAEVGYEATGVREISEISGVSTRSLYNLFPGGKEECFLVVLDQILEGTQSALSSAADEESDWERRVTAIYARFAEMVSAQPAAAALVLTGSYAAGPEARQAVDTATATFERLYRRSLKGSPERAGLPDALVAAQVGALQELARTRLRHGEAGTLPALVPELVDLAAGYRPPPERLRLGNRRPVAQADSIASSEEAERAIRGLIMAIAEHGYEGATIRQIVQLGSMSLNTFYANFPDKRAVLLAAVDSSTAQMQAVAMSAYRRSPGWALGIRAAIGGALGFLAARPATAKLLLTEVYAGGTEALGVRSTGLRELMGVLEDRTRESPEVPRIAPELILGGILALARRQLAGKGAESLPSIAPIATYIALAPYVGAAEACSVANSDARPGNHAGQLESSSSADPAKALKWILVGLLGDRWATAEELAEETDASTANVLASLSELEQLQIVEQMTLEGDDLPRWANAKKFRSIDEDEWAALSARERHEFTSEATRLVLSDLDKMARREDIDVRLDEHYTRITLEVDQEGWTEIAAIHRSAFHATEMVREKSERRLRRSGARGIQGRSIQLLIEASDEE